MSLAPNQHLFEYRIARVLGQGAFGTVCLARDTLLDRPVAIKELTVTAQTDEVAFKRFVQEARAAGGLNHPHVVTVYALKIVKPNVYLVMEYLAGGSLRALLEEHSPLPVEQAVRIAAEVCEGLAAAHAKGIVHRDVKPENILLAEDGRAKVGDFGIAHVPRGTGGTHLSQLTGTGFQPGTLLYMSPEQIRGQQVDGRSDVYQVGALLYEMLTGRHYVDLGTLERQARETAGSNVVLFQARLYELLAEAVCEWGPKGVCQIRSDVPGWIGEVMTWALAKGVEERPVAHLLAKAMRGGEAVWNSLISRTPLSEFLDRVGGIPEDNRDPSFGQVNEELRALLSQMSIEETCRELEREVIKRPNGRCYKLLGLAYFNAGCIDDAIRLLELSLRHTIEDSAAIYETLGQCYILKEDWTDAEKWFAHSDRYNFRGLVEKFGKDFVYVSALGKQQAGMPAFGRLNDSEFVTQYRQLQMLAAMTQSGQYTPDMVRAAASELRQSLHSTILDDRAPAAVPVREPYPGALSTDSVVLAEACFNRGVEHAEQGHLDGAIPEFQAALRINPDYAEAHYNLGLAYRQQGRLDEAIREYQAALRINPDDAGAHYSLGLAYGQQGRLDDAIREYQAALHINPDYTNAHYNLGLAYRQQGRLDEAIREYQAALRISPDEVDAHYGLGVAYEQQGRPDEAIREYQAALHINPSFAEAHYGLGVVYEQQGHPDEAIREFQAALHINPDYADAYYNLGLAYGQQGRLDDEIRELQIAAQLGSQQAQAILAETSSL